MKITSTGDSEVVQTRIPGVFSSNLGQVICYPDKNFRGFSQFLQANAWIIPRLDHGCFLSNPLQFIVHLSSRHSILYNAATDSIAGVAQSV